jgi:hypothetical protein
MEAQHDPDVQWSVYEANVQAYRGLSISSQSLFLAVGAILLGADSVGPFLAVLVLAQLTTWYIWFPVIYARTAIVDYHKYDLGEKIDSAGKVMTPTTPPSDRLNEREYARSTNFKLRRAVRDSLVAVSGQPFRTLRTTRFKIDVLLPAMFAVVWAIFAVDIFS